MNTREFYGEHYSQLATKFIDWSWRYLMKKEVYLLHQDVLGIWLVIVYDNQKVDKCLIFLVLTPAARIWLHVIKIHICPSIKKH